MDGASVHVPTRSPAGASRAGFRLEAEPNQAGERQHGHQRGERRRQGESGAH